MAFYLGIDGGATKTKFLLGDERLVLAEALGAGSNVLRSGEDAVRTVLQAGIDEACTRGGIQPAQIRRTVAGIAGSSNEDVRLFLQLALRKSIPNGAEVVGDMVIAHHAALSGNPGVMVNAGTGSIAYGRNAKGETARAGGWGIAISDEGSGDWIGRAGVAIAMRTFDAGEESELLLHLMTAASAHSPQDLARVANGSPNANLARLFPEIVSLAQLGDSDAAGILKRAGEELSRLANNVMGRVFRKSDGVRVAALGGVFRGSDAVFQSFRGRVHAAHPETTVTVSNADPALGALMLARTAG